MSLLTDSLMAICAAPPARRFPMAHGLFPLCGRCTGIYMGFAGCVILSHWPWNRLRVTSWQAMLLGGALIGVMPLEVLIEQQVGMAGTNALRYLTGLAFGAGLFLVLFGRAPAPARQSGTLFSRIIAFGTLVVLAAPTLGWVQVNAMLAVLAVAALFGSYLFVNWRIAAGICPGMGAARLAGLAIGFMALEYTVLRMLS